MGNMNQIMTVARRDAGVEPTLMYLRRVKI